MRTKNELAVDRILECALSEFMEKGFEGASMRTIADKSGYTTGMMYAERQYKVMPTNVDKKVDVMIDIIYDNYDAFKLIVCRSAGNGYEYYIDKMIDVETKNTVRFIKSLTKQESK